MDNNQGPTPGVSAPGPKPVPSLKQLIASYVALRDRKRLMESQHKEALKPINEVMEEIEGHLLAMMQRDGVNSLATDGGTAYQSVKRRAPIKDRTAFRDFVISQQQFDLVDWKANAPNVFDYIEANGGKVPPGLNPSSYTEVNVRRPGEE